VADQPYQSLYRRYRPQRFAEVRGQDHVTRALKNAVRDGRVAHAYLFSGPRGTGKTSTARILAKALNCHHPTDGEPCGTCESCEEVTRGSSLDVHELDAASNNGVDAMRDLVARAALGTPGRWKVYIVDEVHMLSAAASNALLKTLEEPPGHVVFVLATTDAQKVLPTIRSRTQHFEFRLLGRQVLEGLVGDVVRDAGLEVSEEAIDQAVRRGNGSARDALSALDQVAASGTVDDEFPVLDALAEALCERDTGGALEAVAEAAAAGRDPQRLAADLVEHLRQGFLASMAPNLVSLGPEARERVEDQARRMGMAALVRSMEVIGRTQVEMRDALDPRLSLEVALVRLSNPEADDSSAALVERLERLERRIEHGSGAPPPAQREDRPAPSSSEASSEGPPRPRPADAGRAALGALRKPRGRDDPPAPGPPARNQAGGSPPTAAGDARPGGAARAAATAVAEGGAAPRPDDGPPTYVVAPSGSDGTPPSRDELVKAWGDVVLAGLKGRARALYRAGRFVRVDDDGWAVFALPDETHRSYSEECRVDVESALSAHFGARVRMRLIVEDGSVAPLAAETVEDYPDPDELDGPAAEPVTIEKRLIEMFPGAEEVPGS
jgi:DNA polymerase-3 subunit gamma/tau